MNTDLLPGGPAARPQPPQHDNRFNAGNNPNLMGPDYFKDKDQLTWADNAQERYTQEHGIDLATGGITGPLGPIPAGIAQQWQAAHDQAVWNARNRMAKEAFRMGQGASGLLESYRAGGGTALQANTYGNLANLQMQRAQMMQPLDLLGDYRRDALARIGKAGRAESQWGAGLQGLGAIASIAIPYVGPIIGAGLAAAGGIIGSQGAAKRQEAMATAGVAGQATGGAGTQMNAFAAAANAAKGVAGAYNAPNVAPGQGAGTQYDEFGMPRLTPGERATAAKDTAINDLNSGQTGTGNFIDGASAQGQGQGQQVGEGQGGPGQQKSMGMPALVGQDGMFDPTSYGANGMNTSPAAPVVHQALTQQMAERVSADPSWSIISMAWDRELALRTVGAA